MSGHISIRREGHERSRAPTCRHHAAACDSTSLVACQELHPGHSDDRHCSADERHCRRAFTEHRPAKDDGEYRNRVDRTHRGRDGHLGEHPSEDRVAERGGHDPEEEEVQGDGGGEAVDGGGEVVGERDEPQGADPDGPSRGINGGVALCEGLIQ